MLAERRSFEEIKQAAQPLRLGLSAFQPQPRPQVAEKQWKDTYLVLYLYLSPEFVFFYNRT
jgi:hypothetical protein